MTKYTIAYQENMLLICVPDSASFEDAIRREELAANIEIDIDDLSIESGVILTDDRPDDVSRIAFICGSHTGDLVDENGVTYQYAIRA